MRSNPQQDIGVDVKGVLQAAVDVVAYGRHLGLFDEEERYRLLQLDRARYEQYAQKQRNKKEPVQPYEPVYRPIYALEAAVRQLPALPAPSPALERTRPWSGEIVAEEPAVL